MAGIINRVGNYQSSPITTKQTAENVKRNNEQQKQEEQIRENQDLSKGSHQAATAANVTCTIINGKPTFVSNNKGINKDNTKDTKNGKSQKNEGIATQKTESTYYFGYSCEANNYLNKEKDINLSSIGRGIQIDDIEDKEESVNTGDFQKSGNGKNSNARKMESIHWVSEDLRTYYNKHGINFQKSSLISRVNSLYSSNLAVGAYGATKEAMQEIA